MCVQADCQKTAANDANTTKGHKTSPCFGLGAIALGGLAVSVIYSHKMPGVATIAFFVFLFALGMFVGAEELTWNVEVSVIWCGRFGNK